MFDRTFNENNFFRPQIINTYCFAYDAWVRIFILHLISFLQLYADQFCDNYNKTYAENSKKKKIRNKINASAFDNMGYIYCTKKKRIIHFFTKLH